jgi:hypothetical protein
MEAFETANLGVLTLSTYLAGEVGRTSAGLARIAYVFLISQYLQGWECSSSPTSGAMFPQVGGFVASKCVQNLTYSAARCSGGRRASVWWRHGDGPTRVLFAALVFHWH